jgi:DNA-binding beta-propeller fold protein YncE
MVWNKTSSAVLMHERHFGESGRNPGQFRLPRHICALPDGNLCISDTVNQRLQVVTPEGEFVNSIGKAGAGPGELRGPSGVTCENGCLFVVEGGNHRVQKLALADGAPIGRAGSHGSKKNGELWCPHGVTISKGQAYVADYINGRVVVFDCSNMEHVRTFGARGAEPGQLEYPCGIAIKGEEVYVAEYGNHRISVFTKRGNFERIIGSEGKAPGQFYQPRCASDRAHARWRASCGPMAARSAAWRGACAARGGERHWAPPAGLPT